MLFLKEAKMTNTTWRSGVCAAVLAMAVAPGVFSADWTTIYDENFSSDPGWVSNNPANYYWDSGAGNFFERQVDASGEYAYKLLPDLTQGFHWKLEFDIQPLSNTGAGNRRLSLTSSDMVVSGTPSQPFITLDFNNFNDQIQLLWNDRTIAQTIPAMSTSEPPTCLRRASGIEHPSSGILLPRHFQPQSGNETHWIWWERLQLQGWRLSTALIALQCPL